MTWLVFTILIVEIICGIVIIDLLMKIHRAVDWDAKVAFEKAEELRKKGGGSNSI